MLLDADKAEIQQCYRDWLESKQIKPRHGQRHMIAEVARVLAHSRFSPQEKAKVIAAIEAGTGTGKTVAYLLPALVLARSLDKKLLVSTATVALQEQLIHQDLPDLQEHAGLEFEYGLAKGRNRYICKAKLVASEQQQSSFEGSPGLFPDEQGPLLDRSARQLYADFSVALEDGSWDGDRDSWASAIAQSVWHPLTSDHVQCTGRRCTYVKECAYFTARASLEGVDCVIANHDLVLADLALGGGVVLSEPEETLYIFDEAHQLAEKAQRHFGHRMRLSSTRTWLDQLIKWLAGMAAQVATDPVSLGKLHQSTPMLTRLRDELQACQASCQNLLEAAPGATDEVPHLRFPVHDLPPVLGDHAHNMGFIASRLTTLIDTLCARVEGAMKGEVDGVSAPDAEQWFMVLGMVLARLRAISGLAAAYDPALLDPELPYARWLSAHRNQGGLELELAALPLLPRRLLDEMLWSRCAAAILTSASMTALGRFDRLKDETGIPTESRCLQLASPFNHFEAAELCVPSIALDPAVGDAYTDMLCEAMPGVVSVGRGTLVLFSARRQMQSVYDRLPEALRRIVLNQDAYAKRELLQRHRAAVDRGDGSVIFGLGSFAEGVDLPGAYCAHVVITRLPFAVPDDPVEAARAEWVKLEGGNPFRDIALPDAARRLVQASGRLLRTEQDRGTITVLDRRLLTRSYGRELLQSLPNYRLVVG